MFFIIKEAKETMLDFLQGTVRVLWMYSTIYFYFNITLVQNDSIKQLNKLKSGLKNGTEVTLNLSSNVVGNSNDETNFRHRLLLINTPKPLPLQIIHQLIQSYQELNYIKYDNQEDF